LQQHTENLPVRILKEFTSPGSFQWNFRESYASLAARLGADEETVRLAVKKVIDSQVVVGWRLVINPHFFGMQLAGFQLEVRNPRKKEEALSQLRLVDGLLLILDFHGKSLRVATYYENEKALRRKIDLIKTICGNTEEVPYWTTNMPRPEFKLGATDWKILCLIRKDPRRDVADIAEKVRLSTRTVNRRLRMMINNKVAYLIPIRNVKKSRGVVACFLVFTTEAEKREILKEMESRGKAIDFSYTSVKDLYILSILLDNLSEAEDLLSWLKGRKEIENVKMEIMKEFIFLDEWLDERVNRQIC
jgi:DNA-binding Lrp family transcriptional regulator